MQIRIEKAVIPAMKKLARENKRSVSAEANLAIQQHIQASKSPKSEPQK